MTVGYGGMPDRNGKVTLGACIMDEKGRAGSVAFLIKVDSEYKIKKSPLELFCRNPINIFHFRNFPPFVPENYLFAARIFAAEVCLVVPRVALLL